VASFRSACPHTGRLAAPGPPPLLVHAAAPASRARRGRVPCSAAHLVDELETVRLRLAVVNDLVIQSHGGCGGKRRAGNQQHGGRSQAQRLAAAGGRLHGGSLCHGALGCHGGHGHLSHGGAEGDALHDAGWWWGGMWVCDTAHPTVKRGNLSQPARALTRGRRVHSRAGGVRFSSATPTTERSPYRRGARASCTLRYNTLSAYSPRPHRSRAPSSPTPLRMSTRAPSPVSGCPHHTPTHNRNTRLTTRRVRAA
jgi:hypothetical protein